MGIYLKNVTGRVTLPNGQVVTNGFVIFTLKTWDKDGPNIFVPNPVSIPISSGGELTASLQTTAVLDAGTLYDVHVDYFSEHLAKQVNVFLGTIAVPDIADTASVRLADLLAIPAPVPNVPDALAQALAAAAAAAASAEGMEDNAERAELAASDAEESQVAAQSFATNAAASAQEAKDIAGSVGIVIATQPEAEAGTDNSHLMTSLRTRQSVVSYLATWKTANIATQPEAEAGTDNNKLTSPLRVAQYVASWFTSKIATTAQATAASIDTVIMTPLKVGQWFASVIATQAEAVAGTVSNRAMTPLGAEQHMMANALGWGQSWQDMTVSRTGGTAYQNTTGRPIAMFMRTTSGSYQTLQVSPNGTTGWVVMGETIDSNADKRTVFGIVPAGHYYRLSGGGVAIWSELR